MTPLEPQQPLTVPAPVQAEQIRTNMRRISQRQWWLWSSAVMVTLLLTLGIASFAFPGLLSGNESLYSFRLDLAMRGLVGLVLLFNVYTVYQQLQIHRIQNHLSDQVEALGKMEIRTEEVYKLAVLDPLTGLHNRRSGEQRLAQEISRSRRYARPLTVILLDLDNLKQCNDQFGHEAGDEMLRAFSQRLTRAIRGSDMAVRIGGDEFMAILPECRADEVRHVISRLENLQIMCAGQTFAVTFARGWADYQPGETAQQLLKRADDALYADKRLGKDTGEKRVPVPVPQPAS